MKSTILLSIVIFVFATGFVSAEIVRGINIDFVTIGNPGNPGDTRAEANPYGCGAVDYEYRISKYEITNTQWNNLIAFAGAPSGNNVEGYNPYDESAVWTDAQQPTNEVSWYEATQFCNYLTSGDKSQGAYQFSGDNLNPGDFLGIDRDSAVSTYGIAYVLPTEDEWYKAAYYTSSGYSTYANGTEVAPIAGDDTNYNDVIGQPWDVGTGTMEQNGTFDMMGNTYEWNETLLRDSRRGLRGASYQQGDYLLKSSERSYSEPPYEYPWFGFRVASVLPTNIGPIAVAGKDQTFYIPVDGIIEVYFDGTGSYDDDGDMLEYFWHNDANELIATGAEPNVLFGVGEYIITLIVNDGVVDSEPDSCVITVFPAIKTQISTRPGVVSIQKLPIDMLVKMKLPANVEPFDIGTPMTLEPWGVEAYDQFFVTHGKNNLVYAYFTLDGSLEFAASPMAVTAIGQLQSGEYIYSTDSIKIH